PDRPCALRPVLAHVLPAVAVSRCADAPDRAPGAARHPRRLSLPAAPSLDDGTSLRWTTGPVPSRRGRRRPPAPSALLHIPHGAAAGRGPRRSNGFSRLLTAS